MHGLAGFKTVTADELPCRRWEVRSRNSRGCVVVGGVTVGHAAGRCEGFAGQVGGCFHA